MFGALSGSCHASILLNRSGGWSCIQSKLQDKSAIGWAKDKVAAFSQIPREAVKQNPFAKAGLFPTVYISNTLSRLVSFEPWGGSAAEPSCSPDCGMLESSPQRSSATKASQQWPRTFMLPLWPTEKQFLQNQSELDPCLPILLFHCIRLFQKPPRLSSKWSYPDINVLIFQFLSKHDIHLF